MVPFTGKSKCQRESSAFKLFVAFDKQYAVFPAIIFSHGDHEQNF